VSKPVWIKTSARKPEDLSNVDVLIGGKRRITDCTYIDGLFTFRRPDNEWTVIKSQVTHWMYVPELPKL
jgi:hypothetical protein